MSKVIRSLKWIGSLFLIVVFVLIIIIVSMNVFSIIFPSYESECNSSISNVRPFHGIVIDYWKRFAFSESEFTEFHYSSRHRWQFVQVLMIGKLKKPLSLETLQIEKSSQNAIHVVRELYTKFPIQVTSKYGIVASSLNDNEEIAIGFHDNPEVISFQQFGKPSGVLKALYNPIDNTVIIQLSYRI